MALPTTEDLLEKIDTNQGWCLSCGEWTHDTCEPDATEYECPVCGDCTVYGAEHIMMGIL